MAKYVPDILSRRWVIISPARTARPEDDFEHEEKHDSCVFCPGNEEINPVEVLRFGKGNSGEPGWTLRVLPNKYPITDFHEVIVHTPECNKDLSELPLKQIELVFQAYRERFNYYKDKGQVLIFCNEGEHAGASIIHSHSQLVVIPNQINLDALSQEPLNNVVDENMYFHVYCPDFSQWPYEVWLAPKKKGGLFGNISDVEIGDMAELLKKILNRLKELHGKHHLSNLSFGYNYYIYPKENWYLRIIPRFVHRAGFELGTGLSVNVVDPYQASMELKGIDAKTAQVLQRLSVNEAKNKKKIRRKKKK